MGDDEYGLMFTGLVYSRLEHSEPPSLETDKLDLTDIIAQMEEMLSAK